MNQIAERNERPSKPALLAGGSISAIVPQSIEESFRLSEAIHMSGMAPNGFDSPQKVMIAMLAGLEIGLPPMAAVQSVAVINNRPCIWGDALIGVVRKSPLCQYVTEWIEGEGDEMIAYCETHRRGEPRPVKMSFSVADAKKAGLWQTEARVTKTGKNGTYQKDNDSPWYKYPKRMLQMRARAWCLRDVYADVTKGMQVREEVEDYQHVGPDNARDITPAQPSVMARLRAAQEAPHPSEDEREGFDAAFVHSETETALTGEIMTDTNTGDNPPAPSPGEEDETANPAPVSSSTIYPTDRADLIECCRKLMFIVVDPSLETPQQRRDTLINAKDMWKGKLPEELHPHIAGFFESAYAQIKADPKVMPVLREKALTLYAEVLDCKASDLGGVDG